MPGTPLLYALHSGNLYGTERMALATVQGLLDEFEPTLFAPPGPALQEAERRGIAVRAFASPLEFARQLRPYFARHARLAFVATGVVHSLACLGLQLFYRRKVTHLHIVHGGTYEALSYGRKRYLNPFPVIFVAVSEFVRERLLDHGVRPRQVTTVENFLLAEQIEATPRRPVFAQTPLHEVIVVSRVDPIKRIDLLLAALEREPRLCDLQFRIYGTGSELDRLRQQAARHHVNVTFAGFCDDIAAAMTRADLLLHLCPVEPFGLAILEAMAADLPVLVPDAGGAGALVRDGQTGFRFRADDPAALTESLLDLRDAPSRLLNQVVRGARLELESRFSERARLEDYRLLLRGGRP